MSKELDTQKFLDAVVSALAGGSSNVPVPVAGNSMAPFLHPGDTVYLNLLHSPLRRGDIVLFTRPNGDYVLHRVYAVGKDGSFTMLGDGQMIPEPVCGPERIQAVVTRVRRNGRLLEENSLVWRFFSSFWLWLRPLRPVLGEIIHFILKNKTR